MAKAERERSASGSEVIHPQLAKLAVPMDSLVLDPGNARLHGDRNIESIKASLLRFGQRKPVVVRKGGMVIEAGNGTYEAAKALGWKNIAAVICDDDDDLATAYGIADNRSADLAEWDYERLAESLSDLRDGADPELAAIAGFTDAEIEQLLGNMKVDDSDGSTEIHLSDVESKLVHQCPKCGFKYAKG